MAEQHDRLVSAFTHRIARKGYTVLRHSPFVDYRPDVHAKKGGNQLFAEMEIQATLHSEHTLQQLSTLHRYLANNRRCDGFLVVPHKVLPEARMLLKSVFGDGSIRAEGM